MSWIRIDSELFRAREFLLMKHEAGLGDAAVMGGLTAVWLHVDEFGWMEESTGARNRFSNSDATLADETTDLLKLAIPEDCRPIVDAMVSVGWIRVSGPDLVFPNFGRRAPKGLRRNREAWGKNQASNRWKCDTQCDTHSVGQCKERQTDIKGSRTKQPNEANEGTNEANEAPNEQNEGSNEANEANEAAPLLRNGCPPPTKESKNGQQPPYDEILSHYHETTKQHLPSSRQPALTASRRRKITTRWKDADWRGSWREAIDLIPQCPFLMGKNDRGWTIDFSWLLEPDSVAKICEGKYLPPGKTLPADSRSQETQRAELDSRLSEVMAQFCDFTLSTEFRDPKLRMVDLEAFKGQFPDLYEQCRKVNHKILNWPGVHLVEELRDEAEAELAKREALSDQKNEVS